MDPAATATETAYALEAMRAFGPVLALTIRAEIGAIQRFATGAQLASYAGVVPRVEIPRLAVMREPLRRHRALAALVRAAGVVLDPALPPLERRRRHGAS